MAVDQELKKIIKEELMSLFNEDDITYNDQVASIEKLIFQIKDANVEGNQKKANQLLSILTPQLISIGYSTPHLSKMKQSIKKVMTDKDVYLILSTYKLMAEADTNETTPTNDIYTYTVIVEIPFATNKNKDEKISQLKYELVTSGVKVLGIKKLPVAEIAKAAGESVIKLHVMMSLKTYKKRTELENDLQPSYKLIKIKNTTSNNE